MPKKDYKTSIGGQALIEGVMMRGPQKSAMAVRLPGGEIDIEEWENPAASGKWYRKTPFVRGIFNLVDALSSGYKCLMKSAEKSGMAIEEEPSRFEKWLTDKLGDKVATVFAAVAMVVAIVLAVGLFMILPLFLADLIARAVQFELSPITRSFLEGVIRIFVFVMYILLSSKVKDVHRTFEYHGAEHKTIACYEAGGELTVENVRKESRFHPRCGTSFLLIVLVISILTFSFVQLDNVLVFEHMLLRVLVRAVLRFALLPVVVGIAYEIIKLAGRHDNILTRVISAPGLWFQRLTAKEPDDSQIEIAIASMLPVIPAESGADEW